MKLFDFSLLVGNAPKSPVAAPREALIRYLDRADVAGVVASSVAAHYDFLSGNPETLAIAKGEKRLLPAVTADPRRIDVAELDFDKAAAQGFRALALFPAIQHWGLSHPGLPDIIARAAAANLPIVVHVGRSEAVAGVRRIAESVSVPVIVVGIAYGTIGEVAAGAAGVDNLLFDMSLFVGLDNVEALVKRLGAGRLVFASGEPRLSHAPGLAILESAEISAADRETIAVGNARRIFGGGL